MTRPRWSERILVSRWDHRLGRSLEMEATALSAFSTANRSSVACFAHVTNAMAQTEGDFEKGQGEGAKATLAIVAATARAWRTCRRARYRREKAGGRTSTEADVERN